MYSNFAVVSSIVWWSEKTCRSANPWPDFRRVKTGIPFKSITYMPFPMDTVSIRRSLVPGS